MPICLLQTGIVQALDGGQNPQRGGQQGEALCSELHGRYYEQTYRKNMFAINSQAAVTTTAALNTTFTGLVIGNPLGSGVNAVLNKFHVAQFAVGAAAAVGIMTGQSTTAITGTLTPRNQYIGGTAARVVASAGQTIGTPVLERVCGSVGSVATTAYGLVPGIVVDLEGSIILPPGYFAASFTSIATTTALLFGFAWEEVPI